MSQMARNVTELGLVAMGFSMAALLPFCHVGASQTKLDKLRSRNPLGERKKKLSVSITCVNSTRRPG